VQYINTRVGSANTTHFIYPLLQAARDLCYRVDEFRVGVQASRERISRGRRSSRLRGNEFPRAKGECPVLHDEAGTMLHKRPTTFVLGEPAVNDAIDGYTPWHNAALPPHYLSNRTRRTYTLHPATTQPTRTFRGARESSRQVTVAHHVARGAAHLTRNSAQTLDFPTVHIIILVTCIWPSFHANF
jgi:hypothetical protein